jgi:hypothetical protein
MADDKKAQVPATPEKHAERRRKLLKGLAAGGGAVTASKLLPESWGKPILDAIVLPAHAQATGFRLLTASALANTTAVSCATSPDSANYDVGDEDFGTIVAELNPAPNPGVLIDMTMSTPGDMTVYGGGLNQNVTTDPTTGQAAFTAIGFYASDLGDAGLDRPAQVSLTFQAATGESCTIVVNMSIPG